MRGETTEVAPPPVLLRDGVPAGFLDGDVVVGMLAAFDAVLAPVVAVLDDLDAYVDLRHAPDDFVRWVGSWLALGVDDRWPAERVRRGAADLASALVGRGTVRGLEAAVRACTGTDPVLRDTGGVSWSPRPGGALPGRPGFVVELDVPLLRGDGEAVRVLVRRAVEDARPLHVRAAVRFTDGG